MGWALSSSLGGPGGGDSVESAREARLAREAAPPFRPAMRASSEVNSCAVPFWCAAFPPLRAISRCFCGSMEENPRLPGTIDSFRYGAARVRTGTATCASLPASSQAAAAGNTRAMPMPRVGFALPRGACGRPRRDAVLAARRAAQGAEKTETSNLNSHAAAALPLPTSL